MKCILIPVMLSLSGNVYSVSISVDSTDLYCQDAKGFGDRIKSEGFFRVRSLKFGWGEFNESTTHNISGSNVETYAVKSRNQWALYVAGDGRWKLFQGVARINLRTRSEGRYVCTVKSGSK